MNKDELFKDIAKNFNSLRRFVESSCSEALEDIVDELEDQFGDLKYRIGQLEEENERLSDSNDELSEENNVFYGYRW